VRKLFFGAVLGALLMYLFDAQNGAERRGRLSRMWSEQRDSVLDLARTAGGAAGSLGQGVTELVDTVQKPESNGLKVETGAVSEAS